MPLSCCALDDGGRQRMFAGAFQAGRELQHVVFLKAFRGEHGDQFRPALGERAGLVDDQGVDLLHDLQRLGVFDQHAQRCALAGADHDRHGRGQPQRAGAGDDEHGHGVDDGVRQPRLRSPGPPHHEGHGGDCHHDRDEPAGDDVGKPLDRGARALRRADHLHDAREQGVGADLLGAQQQAAGAVHGGTNDARAHALFHRDRFARHHGLVDAARALGDRTVNRDLLAGPHPQQVAHLHLFKRYVGLAAVSVHAARAVRCQSQQQAQRFAGLTACLQLQNLAKQHQRRDDGGGLEVDGDRAVGVAHDGRENLRGQQGDQAVDPGD